MTPLSPQLLALISAVEAEEAGTTRRIAVNELLSSADIMTVLFKESEVSALLPF